VHAVSVTDEITGLAYFKNAVGHKKPTPPSMLFILRVYMFSCINNTTFQSSFYTR